MSRSDMQHLKEGEVEGRPAASRSLGIRQAKPGSENIGQRSERGNATLTCLWPPNVSAGRRDKAVVEVLDPTRAYWRSSAGSPCYPGTSEIDHVVLFKDGMKIGVGERH